MPSLSAYGERCHESSRNRTPRGSRNRQGSELRIWEVAGNGAIRSVGVSRIACREGWSSEAWDTHNVSPTDRGNHASRRVMYGAGVGATRSNDDARDNITLQERRGRTSAMLVFETEAEQILNTEASTIIHRPVVGSGYLGEVARVH